MSFRLDVVSLPLWRIAMSLGLLACLSSGTVYAADSIGKAVRAVESILIGKGVIASGDDIFLGDEIAVGRHGTLTIQFNDESTLILTPESRARIMPISKEKRRGLRMPSYVVQLNGRYRWITAQAVSQGSIEHIDDPSIFTPPGNEYQNAASRPAPAQPDEPADEPPAPLAESGSVPDTPQNAATSAAPEKPTVAQEQPGKKDLPKPAAEQIVKSKAEPLRPKPAPAPPQRKSPPKPAVAPEAPRAPVTSKPAEPGRNDRKPPAAERPEPAGEVRDNAQPSVASPAEPVDPPETSAAQPEPADTPAVAAPAPQPETADGPTGFTAESLPSPIPEDAPAVEPPAAGSATQPPSANPAGAAENEPSSEATQTGGADM